MDDRTVPQNEVGLIELLMIFFSSKRLIAIFVLAALVIGGGITLLFNSVLPVYSTTFSFSFKDADRYTFVGPDIGVIQETAVTKSDFDPSRFIDGELFSKVCDQNEDVASLKDRVFDLIAHAAVTQDTPEVTAGQAKTTYYTISIPQRYFDTATQASDFFDAVIRGAVVDFASTTFDPNHAKFVASFDSLETYSAGIAALRSEYDYLYKKLNTLIGLFGDCRLSDGHYVSDRLLDLDRAFAATDLTELTSYISLRGIVLNDAYSLSDLPIRYSNMKAEIAFNELKIEELEAQYKTVVDSLHDTQFTSLELESIQQEIARVRKTQIESQRDLDQIGLAYLNAKIDTLLSEGTAFPAEVTDAEGKTVTVTKEAADLYAAEKASVDSLLTDMKNKLANFADGYADMENELTAGSVEIVYQSLTRVNSEKTVSLFIGAGAGALVGLVLACLVNWYRDSKKNYLAAKALCDESSGADQ